MLKWKERRKCVALTVHVRSGYRLSVAGQPQQRSRAFSAAAGAQQNSLQRGCAAGAFSAARVRSRCFSFLSSAGASAFFLFRLCLFSLLPQLCLFSLLPQLCLFPFPSGFASSALPLQALPLQALPLRICLFRLGLFALLLYIPFFSSFLVASPSFLAQPVIRALQALPPIVSRSSPSFSVPPSGAPPDIDGWGI